ncbi:hypothetical protein EDC04DRAFT_2726666 [Pisolithus marmoratus]|nr:hypothetical protein EDC04DRAFT_2726666 [Pisolithus marmoratus]
MSEAPNWFFSVCAFIGCVCCAIPLPWDLEAWNTGTYMSRLTVSESGYQFGNLDFECYQLGSHMVRYLSGSPPRSIPLY